MVLGGCDYFVDIGAIHEAMGQCLAQRPAAMIFEAENQVPQGVLEDAQAEDALVGPAALAEAPGAWGAVLGQRHGAAGAGGGGCLLVQLTLARFTERAGGIGEGGEAAHWPG